MQIEFPIEFIVKGTPVSSQNSGNSMPAWRQLVKAASYTALPQAHYWTEDRVAVTLLYFPVGDMAGDIDNIAKPIIDEMKKHVYKDDHQVNRVLIQKYEEGRVVSFSFPSATLAAALTEDRPVLYVRISTDLQEGQL